MAPEEKSPGRLLVVGQEARTGGLAALAAQHGWQVEVCREAEVPWRLRRQPEEWDAVVLCPSQPLHPFVELCRLIKFDDQFAHLPVVWVLWEDCGDEREAALLAGADDCMAATASPREVVLRLARAIRSKKILENLEDSTAVVLALANAAEGKDAYTCGHVERVSAYAVGIGVQLGLSEAQLETLKLGGIVHDIGKIGVPDQILNKPDKLEPGEMLIVRRHPLIGCDILGGLRMFRSVLPIVRWHHERPNGTGYPDRIGDETLPLLPRIVAVADCFDALTTNRPYRPALPLNQARALLGEMAERGDLDPSLVRVLLSVVGDGAGVAERVLPAGAALLGQHRAPAA